MALVERPNTLVLGPFSGNAPHGTAPHGSACDTCRRRRVKCDGNHPCYRCAKSSVGCTYGSSIRGSSSISYARQLERKVAELEALLRAQPSMRPTEIINPQNQEPVRKQPVEMIIGPGDDYVYRIPHTSSSTFYGRHSGLRVLGAIGDLTQRASLKPNGSSFGRELVGAFESASLDQPSIAQANMYAMLPSKSRVLELKQAAVLGALVSHDQIDHEEFSRNLDVLYATDPENYNASNWTFIAVVFMVMALARRYAPSGSDDEIPQHSDRIKLKGLGYYYASCAALNITDSNDLDSIIAIILQTKYLVSAGMLTKAYARISGGVAQALRMGLHVSSTSLRESFSGDELFQRRRVFASLNMMETFVSSIVGIPRTTRGADATQTVGLQLANDGCSFVEQRPDSPIAETATLEQLCIIIGKIMVDRHPLSEGEDPSDGPWEAASDMVQLREEELEQWHNNLPVMLPDIPSNLRAIKAQLTLRMWHAASQLCLYRPFVHHLSRDRYDPKFNILGYEWGSACVKAAMQAVWVIETGKTHGLFHEAHFGIIYTLSFSAAVLTYFVAISVQQTTVRESAIAALKAIDMLGLLGKHNIVAQRVCTSLGAMMDALPVPLEAFRDAMV